MGQAGADLDVLSPVSRLHRQGGPAIRGDGDDAGQRERGRRFLLTHVSPPSYFSTWLAETRHWLPT